MQALDDATLNDDTSIINDNTLNDNLNLLDESSR